MPGLLTLHHSVTAFSLVLNVVPFFGRPGETLSSRSWRCRDQFPFSMTRALIDATFPDDDHCAWAAVDYAKGRIWDLGRFEDRAHQDLASELAAYGLA